ncbi:carbon-nitrogen hydrolase family protein [Gordonia sp. (in: high G+C Gram-positive bacteria)]|uniref:carbon-nitrogen hydrolase family protein n=1 Tax=Gordonia sp. (in: high G+C Gram-positive bacteria) TaxID=84139 RepID=UPI0016AC7773|nr:carbon-nitrogen hydrolase family protein [Gordonia sp. (in: high G+C Gram-positive bacteria)]NLG47609.1 carbon-nitrogen hydrolase family protein [Gordonia sp. (in: high G+C Gram-positive bacteria)]
MSEPGESDGTTGKGGGSAAVRAAAVQFQGVPGDVAENLRRLEVLITEAIDAGATLIAIPEFATSPLPLQSEVYRSVLPPSNVAVDLLASLARRHSVRLGGSMLIADGGEVYNRYHLFEPDGSVHLHDKDLPTMWENAFYGPGADDGVFDTGLGRMGAAVCWELIRTQTARRLAGVDVVMTGTHWWTVPTNWGPLVRDVFGSLAQYNRYLSEQAPVEFALRVGAPVLQASHCGRFRTDFLLAPGVDVAVPYETSFVGATQIVAADGTVLAARNTAEGAGVVIADIEIGGRPPLRATEDRFWIPALPAALRAYWHQQNLAAKSYYRRHGRAAGLSAAEEIGRDEPAT